LREPDPTAVDVRGVEEVEPELEPTVHDRERRLLVGLHAARAARGRHAEVHGAEAQGAHTQAGPAEESVIHAGDAIATCRHRPSATTLPPPLTKLRRGGGDIPRA